MTTVFVLFWQWTNLSGVKKVNF